MSPSKVSTISWSSFSNIVDGKPRGAKTHHNGINPVNGEKLWDVPVATQQDVDDAVVSANKAFRTWSQTSIEHRKELLQKFCELYLSYKDELTDLLCQETGKPVRDHPPTIHNQAPRLTSHPAPIRGLRSQRRRLLVRPPRHPHHPL